MRIDLHTHSTVSDGTLSPAEVIEAAVAAGLDVVALTDHDSLRGWLEAAQAAGRLGIGFVPGVEISCRWYAVEPAIPLHLLAYYVDSTHAALQSELARVRDAREQRAQRMVELMRADGLDVTWPEVQGYAAGGTVAGRTWPRPPHPARTRDDRGRGVCSGDARPAMAAAEGGHRRICGLGSRSRCRRGIRLRPSPGDPTGPGRARLIDRGDGRSWPGRA